MDTTVIDKIRGEVNQGISAAQNQQMEQAGILFTKAFNRTEELEDDRTRRDEVSVLSSVFENCGFFDLALQAAEEAVDLDYDLGLTNLMAQDIIAVGNAHLNLENTAQAEEHYNKALKIFLDEDDLGNAASANTNLAGIIANRGDIPQAIELLKKSLEYLAKQPFPETETSTRFALLQTMEIEKYDVDQAVENARQLCSRFFNSMPDMHRNVAAEIINQTVQRYLEAHPELDAAAWKAENFPVIYT